MGQTKSGSEALDEENYNKAVYIVRTGVTGAPLLSQVWGWRSHAGKRLAAMSSPTGPSWVPREGSEGGQGSVIGVVVMGSGPNDQLPAAGVRMKSVGPCSDCCPCNPARDRWKKMDE